VISAASRKEQIPSFVALGRQVAANGPQLTPEQEAARRRMLAAAQIPLENLEKAAGPSLSSPKCVTCGNRCMPERFATYTQGNGGQTLEELEDFRHLNAHNYAGEADDEYFGRRRHVLKSGVPMQLTCGAQFDGRRLQLDLPHLRMYSCTVQNVLQRFP